MYTVFYSGALKAQEFSRVTSESPPNMSEQDCSARCIHKEVFFPSLGIGIYIWLMLTFATSIAPSPDDYTQSINCEKEAMQPADNF